MNGQQTHVKLFNLTRDQGNANQTTFCSAHWQNFKRCMILNVWGNDYSFTLLVGI